MSYKADVETYTGKLQGLATKMREGASLVASNDAHRDDLLWYAGLVDEYTRLLTRAASKPRWVRDFMVPGVGLVASAVTVLNTAVPSIAPFYDATGLHQCERVAVESVEYRIANTHNDQVTAEANVETSVDDTLDRSGDTQTDTGEAGSSGGGIAAPVSSPLSGRPAEAPETQSIEPEVFGGEPGFGEPGIRRDRWNDIREGRDPEVLPDSPGDAPEPQILESETLVNEAQVGESRAGRRSSPDGKVEIAEEIYDGPEDDSETEGERESISDEFR